MLRYALIGDPVVHSLSPRMHKAAFAACGIGASYEALRVAKDGVTPAVSALRENGYAGFNVTTPLKEAVLSQLDRCTEVAREIGAVNVVRREADGALAGHNTDGAGLVQALRDVWGLEPGGLEILILGSGPAARAFAQALRNAGAANIRCWSRNAQRARQIGPPPPAAVGLVVCALPAEAIVPAETLKFIGRETRVFDANYAAARCPVPESFGGERSSGLPLLLHQGALAFEWWTGLPAPLDVMRSALLSAA